VSSITPTIFTQEVDGEFLRLCSSQIPGNVLAHVLDKWQAHGVGLTLAAHLHQHVDH
jgi:hypothetical protein